MALSYKKEILKQGDESANLKRALRTDGA